MDDLARLVFGDNFENISVQPLYSLAMLILRIALVIILTAVFLHIAKSIFKRMRQKNRDSGHNDETQIVFAGQIVNVFLYVCGGIGVLYQFETLRTVLYSALAGSGVVAIIIGFASQETLSNIISGIIITMFRPFKIGDFIQIGQSKGTVETITLRHIIIRTAENRRLVVPNSVINKEIIENSNYHDERVCNLIEFQIDVHANIDRARAIIKDEIIGHALFYDNGLYDEGGNRDALIRVTRVDAGAVTLTAYAWAKTPGEAFAMKCDILESVKKRFDAAGFAHPYTQRVALEKDGE